MSIVRKVGSAVKRAALFVPRRIGRVFRKNTRFGTLNVDHIHRMNVHNTPIATAIVPQHLIDPFSAGGGLDNYQTALIKQEKVDRTIAELPPDTHIVIKDADQRKLRWDGGVQRFKHDEARELRNVGSWYLSNITWPFGKVAGLIRRLLK